MQFIKELIVSFVSAFVSFFVSLIAAVALIVIGAAIAAFGLVNSLNWLMFTGIFIALAGVLWIALKFMGEGESEPTD